jgi:hypothetical protein
VIIKFHINLHVNPAYFIGLQEGDILANKQCFVSQ